jgi:hypothetical protein
MMKRELFVTNSSSSSCIVYGIELSKENVTNMINSLAHKYEREFTEEIINYYGVEEDVSLAAMPALITGMDEWWELISNYLPKGIVVYHGEYDDYLDFSGNMAAEVQDGKVVLKNISTESFNAMIDLAKNAGVENPQVQLYNWVEYS